MVYYLDYLSYPFKVRLQDVEVGNFYFVLVPRTGCLLVLKRQVMTHQKWSEGSLQAASYPSVLVG